MSEVNVKQQGTHDAKVFPCSPWDKYHSNPNQGSYYKASQTSIKAVTLMMPTKVVFIIKMPSVKMEIA